MAGQIKHLGQGNISLSLTGNIIGDNFGLARKATAIAVRVLNNGGSGSFAYVVIECHFHDISLFAVE